MELDKKQLRKQLLQMRLAFDDYQKQSHFIIEKLKKDPRFIKSKKIGIYLSYKHEVDTWKLIEEFKTQKEFYVPIVRGKEMYFTLYQDIKIDSIAEENADSDCKYKVYYLDNEPSLLGFVYQGNDGKDMVWCISDIENPAVYKSSLISKDKAIKIALQKHKELTFVPYI